MNKLVSSLLLAACAACGAAADDHEPAGAPAAQVAAPAVVQAPVTGDWRARVAADVAALRAASPELYAELAALAPRTTRAGLLRFTTQVDRDPRAAAVFLDRLARGGASEGERGALVEALPRTGGVFADALAELMAAEPSAAVRAVYVFVAWRAPEALALPVLRRGFTDGDAEVRAAAAGRPPPRRRRRAARARAARRARRPRRRHARRGRPRARDPADRRARRAGGAARRRRARRAARALRALDRVAPGSLAAHPALPALAADADPRIAQLARKVAGAAP